MPKLQIRTDDEVVVISGKDKGKTGKVLRVDREKSRVFVEGLNIIKRHQRPSRDEPQRARRASSSARARSTSPTWRCIDPKDNKPTRIGSTVTADGKRARVAKRSGTQID